MGKNIIISEVSYMGLLVENSCKVNKTKIKGCTGSVMFGLV